MLDEIDVDQFLEWQDYYIRNQWGPLRDDLREEASRRRLIASLFGPSGDTPIPTPFYPYFEEELRDPSEALQELEEIDSLLVPDGKGGYKWRAREDGN